MTLVIDASLTLSWYFEDERTPQTDRILDQVAEHGALVPLLWRLEVANALQVAIRRKRINVAFRDRALTDLTRLPVTTDPDADTHAWTTTLRLADRFQLTVYDALYLDLAQRRELPLGTLDRQLRQSATALGVKLA